MQSSPPATKTDAFERLKVLYGADKSVELTALGEKFKLSDTSPVWTQIADALENRKNNYPAAKDALSLLEAMPAVSAALAKTLEALQGRFIAIFAAKKIDGAVYHFYGHGKEMSTDPGNFSAAVMPKNALGVMLTNLTNALGAAHDIIQGKGAPTNERESAEIFILETQKAINQLMINGTQFAPDELAALNNFKDKALRFFAEECITNATYLLFMSGKRDFDNILSQVDKACAPVSGSNPVPPLSLEIKAMKAAIALSDTRRSEMKEVLAKQELLNSVPTSPPDKIRALEKVLQAAGLLNDGQTIAALKAPQSDQAIAAANQEALMQVEGFLLRVGQNVRMTAELAVLFGNKETPEANMARQKIISEIRQDQASAVDLSTHMKPFLDSIVTGEAPFAKEVGEIDKVELMQQASEAGLSAMVNPQTMDVNGWTNHERALLNFKINFDQSTPTNQQEMADILYFCAAKAPGHKVGQATYLAMVAYEKKLAEASPQNTAELSNLSAVLNEIEKANAKTLIIVRDNSHVSRPKLPVEVGVLKVKERTDLDKVTQVILISGKYKPPVADVQPLSQSVLNKRAESTPPLEVVKKQNMSHRL